MSHHIKTNFCLQGAQLDFANRPHHAAYFAARGLDEKGKATLRRVHGGVANYDVEVEYAIVKNTILEEQQLSDETSPHNISGVLHSYLDCFRGPDLRRTLGSTLPICAQQLTGLTFLNTYASLFFKQSGFTNAFLVTTIMGKTLSIFEQSSVTLLICETSPQPSSPS